MDLMLYSHIIICPLVIVLYHTCTIRADDGDELSNNLFSNLAHSLHCLANNSQSSTSANHCHGLTVSFLLWPHLESPQPYTIVLAIQVAGPTWLRAVIEAKGDAELELMSSTSTDVCELWNGKPVVRAIGSPHITEVFWLENVDPNSPDLKAISQRTRALPFLLKN
ncbi:uncharacterized protein DFL_004901 [Arthrobotrys flagrans]|uniref:Uncharacterized protein n=1 Tax=Arthrobotrys flagrans TaxID=97331 RepID=A0A437A677_ARTFL|nr:hypothetical protein DFL_004901 [Arthrobotrys flagrans]